MRKKITRDQVRLGMYVDGLEARWLDHPFWRSRFKLKRAKTVEALRRSKVRAVWIDTAKGCDVAEPITPEPVPDVRAAATAEPVKERFRVEAEFDRAAETINRAKPVVSNIFAEVRLGNLPELAACMPVVEDISASVARNASAITGLVRLKNQDEYTYMHSVAVCALMTALAMELGLPDDQVREAGIAGLLHDVGKAFVPDSILNKPGQLTAQENEIMRQHPVRGFDMLKRAGEVPQSTLDVCLYHHERMDGRGYPEGLEQKDLSLIVRMSAICDVYDAVTSARAYKEPWEPAEAIARMAAWQGHFDTSLFKSFVKCIGIYPLGSLVSLESGRLAVVIEHNPEHLTEPVVKAFYSIKSRMPVPMAVIDLSHPRCRDKIVSRETPKDWGLDGGRIQQLWA